MVKTIHWKTDYCNTVYKQEKTQPSHTSALHNTEKKLLTELKMFFKNNHLAPVNSWKINQLQDSFLEESPTLIRNSWKCKEWWREWRWKQGRRTSWEDTIVSQNRTKITWGQGSIELEKIQWILTYFKSLGKVISRNDQH